LPLVCDGLHRGLCLRSAGVDHASPAWSVSVFDEKSLYVFFESSRELFTRLETLSAEVARDASVLSRRGPKRNGEIDIERGRSRKARVAGGMSANIVRNKTAEKDEILVVTSESCPNRQESLPSLNYHPLIVFCVGFVFHARPNPDHSRSAWLAPAHEDRF